MRLTTRFAATLLTAGALIAPATMPAAHAVTTQAVTDTGVEFIAPAGVIKNGTSLSVVNARPLEGAVTYTLTRPDGTSQTIPNVAFRGVATFDPYGNLGDAPSPSLTPRYKLTANLGDHFATFFAL